MKKILAAGAVFLPAALASDPIFGFVTGPPCRPCLHEVVANGPGSTQSKEFANYLCMGKGGSAVGNCIAECGLMFDDPEHIGVGNVEIDLIMGALFDYCFAYYPEETCRAFKGGYDSALDEICSGVGTGENNNLQSSAGGTAIRSGTATISSPAPRIAATGTAAAGTVVTGITAATDAAATGSRQTQTPSSAASTSALTPLETLIGLVMLAINICNGLSPAEASVTLGQP